MCSVLMCFVVLAGSLEMGADFKLDVSGHVEMSRYC